MLEQYKQWKKDNPDEGYQYDMIHEFFDGQMRGDLQELMEYALKLEVKADKWDALDAKIGEFYGEEEGSLIDIGEISAIAFGYL